MHAHGPVIGTADAAKERLVLGSRGHVDIDELARGVADEFNQPGRNVPMIGVRLLGVSGKSAGFGSLLGKG